ncbi:hypothetical protein L1987_25386 [Smallanthus sonchifolius]|uniref:Uncharacterized protein n=1 Tax=Smallanthus sonchifolius TaxID=185202 RepID=A0ACB9IN40_9ASTR|nr:hypothetical protein L1987_25386 [Smallanthus sonchifolius]
MKATDIFCASNAAMPITTTMDSDIHHQQPSSASAATRAIDRHNPIIQDQKRLTTPPPSSTNETNRNNHVKRRQRGGLLGWGCTRPGDFISPANSSRFLLTDKALSDQSDPLLKQGSPPTPQYPQPPPEKAVKSEDEKSCKNKDGDDLSSYPVKTPPRSSSSLSSPTSDQQVVVLRVSLHCRGCERKMRKHISKMEGVTSFTIDFMAKKVTVIGDITPLGVLMSVSKVKNAKLLTPTTISSPPEPQMDSNIFEIDKPLGPVA